MYKRIFLLLSLITISAFYANAQIRLGANPSPDIDYASPVDYELGPISIAGTQFLDQDVLLNISGLKPGEKIAVPGEKISKAIENLWKQGLFSDIRVVVKKIQGNVIFLELQLTERPRLSRYSFKGIGKSDADKLRDMLELTKGKPVTDNMLKSTENVVRDYYTGKGRYNVQVHVVPKQDTTLLNSQMINIEIEKGPKMKISKIIFHGNAALADGKLKHALKGVKEKHWYHIFSASRFVESKYEEGKPKILEKYNARGFRDAKIEKDSVYKSGDNTLAIEITISEGKKYHFRNITWVGNTKYSSDTLSSILGIKKGDIFDQSALDARLYMNPNGRDLSSLYLDDGYLFFQVIPVEVAVDNDSIDLEMRIYEGRQAVINKITISGNTKTNDRVILREVRTKPGNLFSRSDIIRSQRELAQLGYFDPEKLGVNPKPNPANGTVDVDYVVEEKPSDQLELSGGWGAGQLVGTLGVAFNNFSARNFFKKDAWRPLPSGDGQRLSVRAQSNGTWFQSYNASFTEPWLGGKKPNSLSVTVYHSIQTNGRKKEDPTRETIKISGVSVGLGKRLKFPDDYFTNYLEFNFQNYNLQNASSTFLFSDGNANNFNIRETISRNSVDQPIYARRGANISFSLQAAPPFSIFKNLDWKTATVQEKYKWVEYHKWKFNVSWFTKITGNLVLNTRIKYGFLGFYDRDIGHSPFERFYLGGDGLSGFSLDGREIIGMRGYENNSLTPRSYQGSYVGGTIFDKYTFELRYPVSLNPQATIFVLAFAEGGNVWLKFKDFNPFEAKRSAGVGLRIFLPMFGLLGLDYGYGVDDIPNFPGANKGQFHFSIGQSIE